MFVLCTDYVIFEVILLYFERKVMNNKLKSRLSSFHVISKKLKRRQDPIRFCSSEKDTTEDEKQKELAKIAENASIDSPPIGCCQSGCSNCVFIVWAEALAGKMQEAGPEIAEKILKMVEDPSMKAYLEMELRLRGLKK